eukprot:4817612-Prymnesium_polylepis.1
MFVDSKLAVWNPKWADDPQQYFDQAEPYDELIHWLPGAEMHTWPHRMRPMLLQTRQRAPSPLRFGQSAPPSRAAGKATANASGSSH